MRLVTRMLQGLLAFLCVATTANAQQAIGSFPEMDGGFEAEPVGPIPVVASIPQGGTQSFVWTTTSTDPCSIDSSSVARTGSKFARFYATTTRKRLVTPTAANGAIANSTLYTIQFYYRTSGATSPGSSMYMAISPDGTSNLNIFAQLQLTGTSGGWQLYRDTVVSSSSANTTKYGLASIRDRDTVMDAPMEIDDYVVYAGAPDAVAPDPALTPSVTSFSSTQIVLGWNPPATGVDGGGYVVVRKSGSAPVTALNANGLYAVGNTVAAGEQVVYVGSGTSFSDNGLTPSTHYYYRIYTADKAFNYSTHVAIDQTTSAPNYATEPTVQASTVLFSGVAPTSLQVSWTAGNGTYHLVVVRAGSPVATGPTDGTSYAANSVYGTPGSQLGAGFVVHNGTGTSVTVTGLSKLTEYHIAVYDFNTLGSAGTENYLTVNPATGSATTLPGAVQSAQSGDWSLPTTWVGGSVPTQVDNVTILAGHTVSIPSTQILRNLTVQSGAVLNSNLPLPVPSNNIRYLKIDGDSVRTDGTLGGLADAIGIECLGSVILTGTGTLSPCRVRPAGTANNITITVDQDMTLTYAGSGGSAGGTALYTENGAADNITITVNNGRTVTFRDSANFYTNNANSNGLANTTVNVNGTINLSGPNSNLGLKIAAGKSCTLNVSGTVTIGRNFNATSGVGGAVSVITVGNAAGSIAVNGTADFSEPSLTVTGPGAFVLGSAATLEIGSPDGISATGATGNIQTAVRNFSTLATYRYVGTAAQITGTGLPATVSRLTISDSLGVTLSNSVAVLDTVHCSTGDLFLNGNTLTLGPAGYLREPEGHSVRGPLGTITTTRVLTAPSDQVNIAGIGLHIGSVADLGSTVITRGHAVQSGIQSIRRYFDVSPSTNTGLNATLVFRYSGTDITGYDETTLALYKSADGGTSWIPEGGTVDDSSNSITLTGVNSFSRWTAALALSVPVSAGWNMISNPVTTTADSVRQLYPTASFPYAFAFDPTSGYVQRFRLSNGSGYWEKFAVPTTQNLSGTRRTLDSVLVAPGWNMIGSISDAVDTSTIVTVPPGLRASQWFGYSGGYSPATQLLPGRGYWVKASGSGVFVLDGGARAVAGGQTSTASGIAGLNTLTIAGQGGCSQTLYFGSNGSDEISTVLYTMPPEPPAGAFDARFETSEGGSMVRTHPTSVPGGLDLPIAIRSIGSPLTISWKVNDGPAEYRLTDARGGSVLKTASMKGEGAVTVASGAVTRIIVQLVGNGVIPADFALLQNYPNPFNPTTSIRFGLPVQSVVGAEIYNLIGQRVRVLLSESMSAGYHSVEWDGRGSDGEQLGGGVYFVRLSATGSDGRRFSDVGKIMMLK